MSSITLRILTPKKALAYASLIVVTCGTIYASGLWDRLCHGELHPYGYAPRSGINGRSTGFDFVTYGKKPDVNGGCTDITYEHYFIGFNFIYDTWFPEIRFLSETDQVGKLCR